MKKLLVMLLCLVMGFSLVACSQPTQPSDSPAASPEATQEPEATAQTQETKQPEEAQPTQEQSEEPAEGAILSTGPKGEQATSATEIILTDEELETIKQGGYTAAISFHYAGNDWSTSQLQGLTDQFTAMGIEIVSVTDANFKPEQQISDIENILALDPDIIVAIPVDPVSTSVAFKQAADAGVKLVFMDNVPDNLTAGVDYTSVVSADNYGNGVAAAEIMAEKLGGEGEIAMVFHDANFFVTNQRDAAFEATITEKYPNITIVEKSGFTDENNGSVVADALLTKHPNLDGIFATWDIPAEGVAASAIAAGRDDLVVTTIDLGNNVATMIAQDGVVKGLGAQLPYDQGVTEAKLAGYALLDKAAPEYVAVPSLAVTRDNILEAYQTVYHKEAPDSIKALME